MPRLHLVRHGRAAASWTEDRDPPLDELGRAQAQTVAQELGRLERLPIVASPLLRCRQTAQPLAQAWSLEPRIVDAVREVPSPIEDLALRGAWIRAMMEGTWTDAMARDGAVLIPWMTRLADTLQRGFASDTVVFSHFIAINVAVGMATGSDRVVNFRPDNCSVTTIDVTDGVVSLVSLGREGETRVTSG